MYVQILDTGFTLSALDFQLLLLTIVRRKILLDSQFSSLKQSRKPATFIRNSRNNEVSFAGCKAGGRYCQNTDHVLLWTGVVRCGFV